MFAARRVFRVNRAERVERGSLKTHRGKTGLDRGSSETIRGTSPGYLGEHGSGTGEKAEKLLHTHYHKRDCYRFAGSCNA